MPDQDLTPTRNARLAALADITHKFLLPYSGLPEVGQVALDPQPLLDGGAEIELQLRGKDVGVREVAAWAVELGSAVRLADQGSYVDVSTWTAAHDARVKVWTHIEHSEAYHLLAGLGLRMRDRRVSVAAFLLLAEGADAPTAQAVSA